MPPVTDSPNKPEPPPQPSDSPAVWGLVLEDMKERDEIGAQKYGQRLKPHDGRDSLVDAYQESLDLAVYLRKELAERLPSGAGRVLKAARAWARQGARSKWTTEVSKRLWDAVAALGDDNGNEGRDVMLRRQAEATAEKMRLRALDAERGFFALRRLSRISEPDETVCLGHLADVAILGPRDESGISSAVRADIDATLRRLAEIVESNTGLRVAALVVEPKPVTIMVDSSEPGARTVVVDTLPDHCPDHPDAEFMGGHGLAGGGFGSYVVCSECGRTWKVMDDAEG